MGRLRELVSKVREEVKPLASVVKGEVAQQVERVKERVLNGGSRPGSSSSAQAAQDEWAFKPMSRPEEPSEAASAPIPTQKQETHEMNPTSASTESSNTTDRTVQSAAPSSSAAVTGTPVAATPPTGASVDSAAVAVAGSAAPVGGATPTAAPAGPVKITAQPSPTDPSVCKFTVEIPVYEDRLIRIKSREQAEDSPLARRIFDLPQVRAVSFAGNVVTVTKEGPEPWTMIARQVGPAIRSFLASGEPALSGPLEVENTAEARDEELTHKVQGVIESMINPGVAAHGGYVSLLGVRSGVAWIQMGGGCQGCGMADLTLKQGIIATIKAHLPEIEDVLDATDHASGENPFYR